MTAKGKEWALPGAQEEKVQNLFSPQDITQSLQACQFRQDSYYMELFLLRSFQKGKLSAREVCNVADWD